MDGNVCGIKHSGRQRTKYTDSLNNYARRKESPNNELIRRPDDREDWKAMMSATDMVHDDDELCYNAPMNGTVYSNRHKINFWKHRLRPKIHYDQTAG